MKGGKSSSFFFFERERNVFIWGLSSREYGICGFCKYDLENWGYWVEEDVKDSAPRVRGGGERGLLPIFKEKEEAKKARKEARSKLIINSENKS